MNPEKKRVLISNATIVSMDPNLGVIERGDLLIEDDRIAQIGPKIACDNAESIDASGMIVAPGFIDTHRHVWQTQLRGVAANWSLFDYTCLMRNAYGASYDPEDAYLGNYAGALEALAAGVTTLVDHSHLQISEEHSAGLIRGLREAGIRGVYCHGLYPNPRLVPKAPFDPQALFSFLDPEVVAFQRNLAESVREEHFPSNDDLLRFGLASSEWSGADTAVVIDEVEAMRRLEPARISIHIGMGLGERVRVVPALLEAGLLGDDLLFVHGAHLTDDDLRVLAGNGGWVSSTPETEIQMGMGYPVVERVAKTGREPSLGIDIVSNYAGDMFAQMRLMLQLDRNRDYENEGRLPLAVQRPATQILRTATAGGAIALGMGELTGSLSPGKQADLILVRTDSIHMSPMNDPVAALVFYAHPSDIDSVWVAGKPRKRGGRLVDVDWPKLRDELERSRERIVARYRGMPVEAIREVFEPIWERLRQPESPNLR